MDIKTQIALEEQKYECDCVHVEQLLKDSLSKVRPCKTCGVLFYSETKHAKKCEDCRFPYKEYGLTKNGKRSNRKLSTPKIKL